MTSHDGRDNGFQQVNSRVKIEEDGVLGGELRITEINHNVNDGWGKEVHGQAVSQELRKQSQGSRVLWERFLHVGSIKVMLVENDDSTRHIVTALLRNCNYEVIEAANGLQAWRFLEDLDNQIDIVLTEVVMPFLSGIALLSKIMSHKTRKNIPVIMMSSHDSMGLVFKCLSKGAVDFLVKPIRKNELKNLWQHVWRRCHSSSGSGSESGTQTLKSVKSKCSVGSDNSSGSNVGEDSESSGDESDDGSGTQSFWMKLPVEVETQQDVSPGDLKPEWPDSTCSIVIRPPEMPRTVDAHEPKEPCDNIMKELVIGKPLHIDTLPESVPEVQIELKGKKMNSLHELNPADSNKTKGKGLANPTGYYSSSKHLSIGTSMPNRHKHNEEFEVRREHANTLNLSTGVTYDSYEVAADELNLKRRKGVKEPGTADQDDHIVLRHPDLSVFSRYNTSSTAFKTSHATGANSSQVDNPVETPKKDFMFDFQSHPDGCQIYQSSNEISNVMDVALRDLSGPAFRKNCLQPAYSSRLIQNDQRCHSQKALPVKADCVASTDVLDASQDLHNELPVQHIHHHHHLHHYHNMDMQEPSSNQDNLSTKDFVVNAPHAGSSNGLGGQPFESNLENCSLNWTASGSKHGSNGQNGSSTAVVVVGTNIVGDAALGGKSGTGDASGSGDGSRIEKQKSVDRVAAVVKFRRKRKERCFYKKVGYRNRKKLAEQRERVRGQFVRQVTRENSISAADD